jgi:uncharacterized protein YlxP (DUF503 family)
MVIGSALATYHLPNAHSLKEKRGVVRSLIARVRGRFDVAIAEVEDQNLWQRATIGIAYVSSSSRHADEVIGKVGDFLAGASPEAELIAIETELVHVF